jgi:DNA polymerase/3'-5' exonuclease PolX
MAHTYGELKKKTVAELREIAKSVEHEAVKGYTQMNKARLLEAVCEALNLEMKEKREAAVLDRAGIKAKLRELRTKRDEALAGHDHVQLKSVRERMRRYKRRLRKATA